MLALPPAQRTSSGFSSARIRPHVAVISKNDAPLLFSFMFPV